MNTESCGRVFVSTASFALASTVPLERLKEAGLDVAINALGRRLAPSDYKTLYQDVDYVIAGIEEYDTNFFRDFPRIKVLSRVGIGLNSIDLAAAKQAGVVVLNTPDAPTQSVAELTLGFLHALARNTLGMTTAYQRGQWAPHLGIELRGETLGLVGFGRIGKAVGRLARAYGMQVVACDPTWDTAAAQEIGVARLELSPLLKTCRFVSIHVPLQADTRHLIERDQLNAMRRDSFLINTARGGVVDDGALRSALCSGQISGAALDVFEHEPDPTHYQDFPNTIFSPHVGSFTAAGCYRMEVGAVTNLLNYLKGRAEISWT